MDAMIVGTHSLSTGGTGQIVISNTINLPSPHAAVAEITLSTFDTASAQFGIRSPPSASSIGAARTVPTLPCRRTKRSPKGRSRAARDTSWCATA